MDDQKIIDIEMTLAHQEKVISELSDVINEQWKEIDRLKAELKKTNTKIDDLELGSTTDEANVKPPHW